MFSVHSQSAPRKLAVYFQPASILLLKLELVSKKLNHFRGIMSFFRDWAPGTLTGGEQTFDYAPPVSVPDAQSLKNDTIPPK